MGIEEACSLKGPGKYQVFASSIFTHVVGWGWVKVIKKELNSIEGSLRVQ
jgi:hypothetical protein